MKMNILRITFLSFFFTCLFANAQTNTVLFTVDDVPVYTTEFKRVYSKNLDLVKDDSQKDIDNYLDLFVKYKLKIAEAKALGMDQKPAYLREFSSYKSQLAKNYLNDSKVTDQLIEEGYQRLLTEVDANHILVKIDENASPKDTLLAYQEIKKLRDRAINEGFEPVKKDIHNGQTLFAEELGFFTAFKMVYPFENAAYNTAVGEWSQPFRTQFGYHVVFVNNKRKNRGDVTVAHIMLTDDKAEQTAQNSINEIYKRLKQGEDFSALAKQFSDDKSSSSNGGKLNAFSAGQLSSKIFEEQAFGLTNVGDVSKPFKSEFGYHIIKLIEKNGMQPFEALELELKNKIKRDSRSKVISDKRIENLLQTYNVDLTTVDLTPIINILSDDYFASNWTIPATFIGEKTLLTIGTKQIPEIEFAQFLFKSQRRRQAKVSLKQLAEDNFKVFVESNLKAYQEENLESENQEYAQVLSEYRDGLLLFDLMENQIWNAAKQDSVGLLDYYNQHKANYYYDTRVDAIVASSAKKSVIKQVSKLLEQNIATDNIKKQINADNQINVSFIIDTLDTTHQALPKGLNLKTGVSKVFKHNDAYSVVKVNGILPKTQKTFEQAKGSVVSDFQEKKEKDWLLELTKKYKVTINKDALKQVKEELK